MSKSKLFSPKAWYLVGAGAVALVAGGARQLLRRRRPDGSGGYRTADVPDVVEAADAKAAGVVKAVSDETKAAKKKAAKTVEAVTDEAKDAKAKVAKTVEAVADEAKDATAKAAKTVEAVADEAKDATAKAAKTVEAMADEATATAAKATTAATAAVADDLTQIKGIGLVFAKRLNEAGYATYADVAAASPDALREAVHATATANPDEWIAAARDML